jgi:hypothetical protein
VVRIVRLRRAIRLLEKPDQTDTDSNPSPAFRSLFFVLAECPDDRTNISAPEWRDGERRTTITAGSAFTLTPPDRRFQPETRSRIMPRTRPPAESDCDSLWRLSHRFVDDPTYFAESLFLSRLTSRQTVAQQAAMMRSKVEFIQSRAEDLLRDLGTQASKGPLGTSGFASVIKRACVQRRRERVYAGMEEYARRLDARRTKCRKAIADAADREITFRHIAALCRVRVGHHHRQFGDLAALAARYGLVVSCSATRACRKCHPGMSRTIAGADGTQVRNGGEQAVK